MTLRPGFVLNGRYRIVKLLGQGGFGAVYRAWDMQMDGACAVKENLDTSPPAQAQFEREAKMLYKLRHPNLPRVFDHFIVPGQGQYLVMDYIEGEDFDAMLERTGLPLPVGQVIPWLIQVCDALAYLHSQDPPIIHRDIKPANIRITPRGEAMLVDFGIAKIYVASKKTTVGARAITPGYSPPEQYGQGTTDARSDVYALGATAYHLLTGVTPPASVDRVVGQQQPPPVHTLNPAVPREISTAIERAMQLPREMRLASALDFKAALASQTVPPGIPETVQVAPGAQIAGTMKVSEPLQPGAPTYPPGSAPISSPYPQPAAGSRRGISLPLLVGLVVLALGCLGVTLGVIFGAGLLSGSSKETAESVVLAPSDTSIPNSPQVTPEPSPTTPPTSPPTATLVPSMTSPPTASPTPSLEPVYIDVYCNVFGDSPVHVKQHQPVILAWGWTAKMEQQVQDHIDAVVYEIFLDGKRIYDDRRDEITQNDDGWYEVIWYAEVGALSPGTHLTEYLASWTRQISDGESTFGPGGDDEVGDNYCEIIVK